MGAVREEACAAIRVLTGLSKDGLRLTDRDAERILWGLADALAVDEHYLTLRLSEWLKTKRQKVVCRAFAREATTRDGRRF